MRLKDLEMVRGYAIRVGECEADLHNDYEFESLQYDVATQSVRLTWFRSIHASNVLPVKVTVLFERISLFKIEFDSLEEAKCDAGTLKFLGFLHPDDREIMDGYLEQEEADSTYHIILGFENGLSVKCYAETVSCLFER